MASIIREPLMQFLTLAALVFMLDAWLGSSSASAPHTNQAGTTILLSEQRLEQFKADYEQRHGQPPPPETMAQFEQNWVREEILYARGLALGLAEHDPVIRERIIKKTQLLYAGSETATTPEDTVLQQFLSSQAERYELPARYSFNLIPLNPQQHPTQTVPALLAQLNDGRAPESVIPLHFEQQAAPAVTARWGPALLGQLEQSQVNGPWHQVSVRQGPALVRLTDYQPPRLPELNQIRSRLLVDWSRQQRIRAIDERLAQLQSEYEIRWVE
ncbi:MAG: hypothetical protein SV765_13315 [Pseudomonadota bacterium]|nr:hypothetical protein [Pseudomonadales bacterium]MDY6921179.1 hypothetical protein [Pseudomonadota bacterium]